MFGGRKIRTDAIRATSKLALKLSCLEACGDDIDMAERAYKFLASDIQDLPDFDIPSPTIYQQIKSGAGEVFGFVKDNKEDILQAISYIQSLRNKPAAPAPVTELPPIEK